MSYRPWLEERALRQMGGLPAEAVDVLVRTLARICEDPYDRLFSRAVRTDDPRERMAELGDLGFVEFRVDEAAGLVRVLTLVWAADSGGARYPLVRTYALSRASAEGGPRTKSSLSTGQRLRSIAAHSSSSSRPSQPSRGATTALRALTYCRSRARQLSRSCLYRASRSRCRSAAPVDSATSARATGTAAPSARAALGETVLGEHPQRGRHCRRAQPGRPGDLGAAGSLRAEHLVHQRGRAAEHQERRVRRLDAASSPPPPADAFRVPVRDPERVAVGPGQLADAHQVDQRVRLIAEYPQDTRHGPVAQRRVQGQVPRAELDHARPADHRGLAEGEQDQADGDSTATPALDPLGILGRAQRSPSATAGSVRTPLRRPIRLPGGVY